jgi:hypothetical protein
LSDDTHLQAFFRLFEMAEERYPHVTVQRLRRLARASPWRFLSGKTAQLVKESVARGAVFSDTRLRLTRSGSLEPVEVYRLNRQHPLVAEALDS